MIVVGVNRSVEASAALRWAIEEAKLRGTSVRAVYAWRRPLPQVWQHLSPELRTPAAMNSLARLLLDEVVDESLVDGDPHVDRVIIVVHRDEPQRH